MRLTPVFVILFILTGCSNKGVYEGIQISHKNKCATLSSSKYNECIENIKISYDEYDRERKNMLSE
jgi:hypothetical protein